MFDGKSKEALKEQLIKQEAQVDHLVKENEFLRGQVDKLQQALIAKESPVAYHHQKMDEAALNSPEVLPTPEEIHEQKVRRETYQKWMENLEGPLFEDADEMVAALTRQIGVPEHESLHGNDES